MGRKERKEIIDKIEMERGSRVLVYVTGDREGLSTQIGMDIFPFAFEHLSSFDPCEKIDVFLYSPGGATQAGFAFANLVREFCSDFSVLVPYKALSSATLISLGANEILMTRLGQLSPIDPSVVHPLSPHLPNPGGMPQPIPVSVEDVSGFLALARDEAGIPNGESLRPIMEQLANSINPIVLGSVHRVREQISFLADMLLKYHLEDEGARKKIVSILTRERFSHSYIISRKEAKEVLGLNVVNPGPTLTDLMIGLYNEYRAMLKLDSPFKIQNEIGDQKKTTISPDAGVLESKKLAHFFRQKIVIEKEVVTDPQNLKKKSIEFRALPLDHGWVFDNNK
jgi:hypothetical protein